MFNEEEYPGLNHEMEQFIINEAVLHEQKSNVLTLDSMYVTSQEAVIERTLNNLFVTYGEEEVVKLLKKALKQIEEDVA